jgi:hypothetical protein
MVGLELPALLNEILGDATGDPYSEAQRIVEASDTVLDAVDSAGVIDRLDTDAKRQEARAVLDAIPPAVDEAIIAALESAFERGLPVDVRWTESGSDTIEARITEDPPRDGRVVRIEFVCPDGATFV